MFKGRGLLQYNKGKALIFMANLRYPAKNDKFFAGERGYSH